MNASVNSSRISRKAHLICFLASLFIYAILMALISRFDLIPYDEIKISENDQLPATYVDGDIYFSSGGRRGSPHIVVRAAGKDAVRLLCHGAVMAKHPNAIPCFAEAFQYINGKPGRVWYMERKFTSWPWGKRTTRMAVQLQAYPDMFFSFDDEKSAIMGIQSGKDRDIPHWVLLYVLKALIHACGFFLVLLLTWTIADKLAEPSKTEPAP